MLTAADEAGGTVSAASPAYYVNSSKPSISLSKPTPVMNDAGTVIGQEYIYTITNNGAEIVSIQLPDGTTQAGTDIRTSSSFILSNPGTYTVMVTDMAGHLTSGSVTIEEPPEGSDVPAMDNSKPEVHIQADTTTWQKEFVQLRVTVYGESFTGQTLSVILVEPDGTEVPLILKKTRTPASTPCSAM